MNPWSWTVRFRKIRKVCRVRIERGDSLLFWGGLPPLVGDIKVGKEQLKKDIENKLKKGGIIW